MVLNRDYGANIPYPYHSLPLKSIGDRLGLYALLGIAEIMNENEPTSPPTGGQSGKKQILNLTLNCGKKPKK